MLLTIPSTNQVLLEAEFLNADTSEGISHSSSQPLYYQHRNRTCFIFTHPYGPLGGNMDNNVIDALFDHVHEKMGFSVLKFNFRGVGNSTGSLTFRATGEMQDLKLVCRYLKSKYPNSCRRFIFCGYSYGSVIANACFLDIPEVYALISISYPYSALWFLTLFNGHHVLEPLYHPERFNGRAGRRRNHHLDNTREYTNRQRHNSIQQHGQEQLIQHETEAIRKIIPKLFIMGARDQFTSISSFQSFISSVQTDTSSLHASHSSSIRPADFNRDTNINTNSNSSLTDSKSSNATATTLNQLKSVVIDQADHFWFGYETKLIEEVENFIQLIENQ